MPGKSSDEIVAKAAAAIEESLPQILDFSEVGHNTFKKSESGQLNSLATVLSQEIGRWLADCF